MSWLCSAHGGVGRGAQQARWGAVARRSGSSAARRWPRAPRGTPLPAGASGEPVAGYGEPRLCSCVAPSAPHLTRLPARSRLPAPCACLVLLPLYTASGDLFLFVFSHLPKCTAAPMMHLCLLFMLMRLTPLAIAIMCSLPAN